MISPEDMVKLVSFEVECENSESESRKMKQLPSISESSYYDSEDDDTEEESYYSESEDEEYDAFVR